LAGIFNIGLVWILLHLIQQIAFDLNAKITINFCWVIGAFIGHSDQVCIQLEDLTIFQKPKTY